jgi:hypothetical protein
MMDITSLKDWAPLDAPRLIYFGKVTHEFRLQRLFSVCR